MTEDSSPGGTSRSTKINSDTPRRPGHATTSKTHHAPRSTALTRDAISVFLEVDPGPVRDRSLPRALGHHLGVPHAGDRRADRREHRRSILVLLLALDLAVRLDAVRATRTRGRDLRELRLVELEPDLLAGLEAGESRAERRGRRTALHRARARRRERRDRGARVLH